MPSKTRLAVLIAFIFSGVLILAARYRLSYDAYTHMFLADHYRLNWWSLWEPRWYAGFAVNSYPPLVHQLIALAGRLIGVDAGFAVVLWLTLAAMPLAVYAFSQVFVTQEAAGYASLGAALLPALYLAAFTFGQLPTLASLVMALFCTAALAEFLRTGSRVSAALAVALAAVVTAAHHATLLLLPWLVLAVGLHLGLNRQVSWKALAKRLFLFGVPAAASILLVAWPFWQWGAGQSLQTPIDHASRHNFLTDPGAALMFFWAVYGPLAAFIPYALWKGRERRFLALSAAFSGLFLLGLGGTTPLPRWIFGAAWEWLTYDRFALWAAIALLPFFGLAMVRLKVQVNSAALAARLKALPITAWRQKLSRLAPRVSLPWAALACFPLLAGVSLLDSLLPSILPTQPPAVDMQPIVNFLASGDRSQWRYLTFGFGDQFASLNRLTSATTIDGSYFTARTLPELRSSGIGQIDGAYWQEGGMAALGPILRASGGYGVRWGFVDLKAYDPVLQANGWRYLSTLSDGIEVWENPMAAVPAASTPSPENPAASFSWGVLPLLALAVSGALAGLRLRPAVTRKVLFGVHAVAIGLMPVGLGLWYFLPLTTQQVPRVYFTYNNALFFLSDGLALVAVLAWAMAKYITAARDGEASRDQEIPDGARNGEASGNEASLSRRINFPDASPLQPAWMNGLKVFFRQILSWPLETWLAALCGLASLSILWSQDRLLALYISLHLWLVYSLFLSLRDRPDAWRTAAIGLCAVLALQAAIGLAEYALQTTTFLAPLGLNWPGPITPATSSASVILLPDGARWLRAYGTLPHPNLLGTLLVVMLSGPAAFFLAGRKMRIWQVVLFVAGLALLVVTFSREAWLGFFAGALLVTIKLRHLLRRRLLALGLAGMMSLAVVILPLRGLIDTRLSLSPATLTEQISANGRLWLAEQALALIRQHPLLGGGAGSFELELAGRAPLGYLVEPVHDLPLLVTSDLGIPGALVLAGIGLALLRDLRKARRPETIVLGAALVAVLVTSLFDHSLWTLAPGRLLAGLVLGLWAGQVRQDER